MFPRVHVPVTAVRSTPFPGIDANGLGSLAYGRCPADRPRPTQLPVVHDGRRTAHRVARPGRTHATGRGHVERRTPRRQDRPRADPSAALTDPGRAGLGLNTAPFHATCHVKHRRVRRQVGGLVRSGGEGRLAHTSHMPEHPRFLEEMTTELQQGAGHDRPSPRSLWPAQEVQRQSRPAHVRDHRWPRRTSPRRADRHGSSGNGRPGWRAA